MADSSDGRIGLLLLDSDQRSSRVLSCSLGNAGFRVASVDTVEAARDHLVRRTPEIILSETFQSKGDAFALCKWVKTTPSLQRTPFVFVTSNTSEEARREAIAAGCDDYLVKPLFFKHVVSRLHALLERRRLINPDQQEAMSGSLTQLSVVDLIQLMELRNRTGVAAVLSAAGEGGKLCFRDGVLVDAEVGELRGEEAVFCMLPWSDGSFQLSREEVNGEATICRPSSALIIDWIGMDAKPLGEGEDDAELWLFTESDDDSSLGAPEPTSVEDDVDEAIAADVADGGQVGQTQASSAEPCDGEVATTAEPVASADAPVSSLQLERSLESLSRPPLTPRPVGWIFVALLLCASSAALLVWVKRDRKEGVSTENSSERRAPNRLQRSGDQVLPQTLRVSGSPAKSGGASPVERLSAVPSRARREEARAQDGSSTAPEALTVLRVRVRLLANAGDAAAMDALVAKHPGHWPDFESLAMEELSRGQLQHAELIAQSLIRAGAEAPQAHLVMGVVSHEQGRARLARQEYERYLASCAAPCAFASEVRSILAQIRAR